MSIDLRKAHIDAKATMGDVQLLSRATPTYAYDNGVPTAKRDGTRYTVAVPACGMATIGVKSPGPQTVDLGEKGYLPVTFDELDMYVYYTNGKPMVGARAKAIHVIDKL